LNIRNLGTAKAKRVAAARLFLLLCVGLPSHGPHEYRERCAQHEAELDLSGASKHYESPEFAFGEL
jgi:hypothetical protein